jgi:hypothetical protein
MLLWSVLTQENGNIGEKILPLLQDEVNSDMFFSVYSCLMVKMKEDMGKTIVDLKLTKTQL